MELLQLRYYLFRHPKTIYFLLDNELYIIILYIYIYIYIYNNNKIAIEVHGIGSK